MDENKYYAVRRYFPRGLRPEELWKMDHRIHLATSSDSRVSPGLSASIAIGEDFEDSPLDITANDECRGIADGGAAAGDDPVVEPGVRVAAGDLGASE